MLLLLLVVQVGVVFVVISLLGTTTLSFAVLLLVLLLVLLPDEVGDSSLSPASKSIAPFSNMHHLEFDLRMRLNRTYKIEFGLNLQTRLNLDSVHMSKIQWDLLLFGESETE